jgi:hypothetical protein
MWLLLLACAALPSSGPTEPTPPPAAPPEPVAALLDPTLADGFDLPVGDPDGKGSYTAPDGRSFEGWYVAADTGQSYTLGVHTGEDWNGNGGGDTDLGQPVHAIGAGTVVASVALGAPWGDVVIVEHRFVHNGAVQALRSVYGHLQRRDVAAGQRVERRQVLGAIGTGDGAYPAHLHLELRRPALFEEPPGFWPDGQDRAWILEHYEDPSTFITQHRRTLIAAREPQLLVVHKSAWRATLLERGEPQAIWRVALGQSPLGHKQRQGDNRTPEGEYTILEKSTGPFTGTWGAYFGAGWLRLSYPNAWDARAGLADGRITAAQAEAILAADAKGVEPPKTTPLGGGIGIHGWAGPWPGADRQNLTWGCLSLQNEDLRELYGRLELGAKVVILP